MRTLFSTWSTSLRGTIGIGVVEDPNTGEKRIRSLSVHGLDHEQDKKDLAYWGATVALSDIKQMIKLVEEDGN